MGWLVLDLRAAHNGDLPLPQKWMGLNDTKTGSPFKPELKISFSVSPAKSKLDYLSPSSPVYNESLSRSTNPAKPVAAVLNPANTKTAINTTNNTKVTEGPKKPPAEAPVDIKLTPEGYYQVGDASPDQQDYTIWIIIAFAQHLPTLLKTVPSKAPFYFYYKFLGNDIVTHPFNDLSNPNFPAERVSIKIRATLSQLSRLIGDTKVLIIYLSQQNKVHGEASVDLEGLVKRFNTMPVIVEGVYKLNPKSDSGECKASLGLSLAVTQGFGNIQIPVMENPERAVKASVLIETGENNAENLKRSRAEGKNSKVDFEDNVLSDRREPEKVDDQTQTTPKEGGFQESEVFIHQEKITSLASPERNNHYRAAHIEQWHKFRFSIELRSVKDWSLASSNCFLKYTYTPFGSSTPFLTHPVTHLTSTTPETLLPHSFCSFEFVMNPSRLETYLEAVPLVIEILHKDKSRKNSVIGFCNVDLGQILNEVKHKEATGTLQSIDFYSSINATGPITEKFSSLGDLRVLLALEDFGVVDDPDEDNEGTIPEVDFHQTLEYQTALELELWKQSQQKEFEEGIAEKEVRLQDSLEASYKQKEMECERMMNEKLEEYQQKVLALQEVSERLQQREYAINRAEKELAIEKSTLEKEAAAALQSQRDAARRLEESFSHSNEMYKSRALEAEKRVLDTGKERDLLRDRILELEVKLQTRHGGDEEKNSEISKLLSANQGLQAQCERLVNSRHEMKKKYKTLFSLYTNFKSTADRQAKELESIKFGRLKELERKEAIANELELQNKENQELKNIEKAVEQLKQSIIAPPSTTSNLAKPLDSREKAEIDRLEREKGSLLETGIYNLDSQLIRDIDARISSIQI